MTDLTKAKIIELVPEIADRPSGFSATGHIADPEITLADVLRAMQGTGVVVDTFGIFWKITSTSPYEIKPLNAQWRIYLGDYDGQTQVVKEFIGKLLGV